MSLRAAGRVPRDRRAHRLRQPARRRLLAVPAARRPAEPTGGRRQRYAGFESGLRTLGRQAQALATTASACRSRSPRRATKVSLWGLVRPAAGATTASIEVRSQGRLVPATDGRCAPTRGATFAKSAANAGGREWRLVWQAPDGTGLHAGRRPRGLRRPLALPGADGPAALAPAARRGRAARRATGRRARADRPRARAVARRRARAGGARSRGPPGLHEPEGARPRHRASSPARRSASSRSTTPSSPPASTAARRSRSWPPPARTSACSSSATSPTSARSSTT